jgi:hypothetical protein
MSRRIGIAGILLASFWFAGCSLLMPYTGPCYGIGCHAGLMAPHGAAQQSAQAKPANTKKSKSFASLMIWRHSKPAANNAPAQSASTSSTAPEQGGGK